MFSKLAQFQTHPHFNISTAPNWLTVKFQLLPNKSNIKNFEYAVPIGCHVSKADSLYLNSYKTCTPSTGSFNLRPSRLLYIIVTISLDGFSGLVVSMLTSGTQVRRFKPDRSRWIFTDLKILSMPTSTGEVKESVPCSSFAACQRT